ncbi:MAG: hypothetical protein F4Z85_09850 [Gemmatimonadetes bacterium]|nr:hypothetical protein [Gemmatimonadota bacterium]MYB72231.1 hypothetical protein [Gemmatimonadota bacterium]
MKPRIVLVLIAVSVVACGQEDPVVARIGDAEISLSQVEQFVERLPQGLRSQDTGRVAVADHVWSLIDHHLTLEEARRRGLAADAEIQRELAHQERGWLARLYRERSGIAEVAVSADDVERTFLRLGFDKERLLTRLIVADENLLAEALGRVRSGAELAEVAHSYGAMDSLALGDGTVGWIGREALARYRIPEEMFFSIQDRRLAPVADLGGAWQIYQFENTRSRPLADVWELVHERTLREHRSRQSHQEYEQLAHQLALRVRPEGVEAALALGSAGVAPQSLEEPLGARVLCDFDGASLTVRDFLTALLRIGFRSALRDSGHVMQLASSEVLPIYLFAAAARSQAWDKEPEFQEFAKKKQQQLMLKALEEQAAAESGPMEEEDIRAYYDRNKGQFRVPESVVIRRLYVDTWEQARDLREEIDGGEELVQLLERPLVARHVHPQLQGIRRFFRIHEAHFPELVAGAFDAATGDVVGPVPVGDGFAVFEVLGHLEPEVQPYDKARPEARRLLLKARTDEAMAGLIRKLREQHQNQITLYDLPVSKAEEL